MSDARNFVPPGDSPVLGCGSESDGSYAVRLFPEHSARILPLPPAEPSEALPVGRAGPSWEPLGCTDGLSVHPGPDRRPETTGPVEPGTPAERHTLVSVHDCGYQDHPDCSATENTGLQYL